MDTMTQTTHLDAYVDTSEVGPADTIRLADHLLDGLRMTVALRDQLGSDYADVYHRQSHALYKLLAHRGHDHDFILQAMERALGSGRSMSSVLVDRAVQDLAESVAEHFGADPDYAPEVLEPGWDEGGGRVIHWEHFPDWAYLVPHGGSFDYGPSWEIGPMTLPEGVRVEAVNPQTLRVLPI